MIELVSYSVSGLRSLASIEDLPVRRPTIITGANDGGKSTALFALDFLLGGRVPTSEDFTVVGAKEDGADPLRHERIEVTGRFRLDDYDKGQLSLGEEVLLRRIALASSEVRYELMTSAPEDVRLRGLLGKKQAELRALGEELEIDPNGPRNTIAAWLQPLEEHAAKLPHEDAWEPAPAGLLDRLPHMMLFSSTEEPDPEGQVRSALDAAYKELLEDKSLVGPIRKVESVVGTKLATKAEDLCAHVTERCPELSSMSVKPEVTFREGFRKLEVMAARTNGVEIPLNRSGAGKRRRINLAIWEWTGNLIEVKGPEDRAVVIAYDEPDTHLDYSHQRELVKLIQSQCAKPGVRIVVATHSLNLIDRVEMESVVHLRLDDELSTLERLMASDHASIYRHLLRVSEAMGLRNSVLLHERSFLGVEGPTEVQTVPALFRLATGMSLQSAGIALIAGNGNDGALNVIKFLKDHGRTMSFLVVDADSTDGRLFRPDKLKASGIGDDEIHFIGTRELEDLFGDDQWAATANARWERTDGKPWKPEDFTALRSSSKFSKAIENLVRGQSTEAPQRKTGYLVALVETLKGSKEVPDQLVEVFEQLAELSASPTIGTTA